MEQLIPITRRFAVTRLWPMWTVFTAVGFIVGFWLSSGFESLAFRWALERFDPRLASWLGTLGYAAGSGLALGSGQALVVYYVSGLRRALPWGLVTGIGETIGIGLQAGQGLLVFLDLRPILLVLPGLTLGVAQWFVLRKQAPNGWSWILMSFVSWPLAAALAELVGGFGGLILAGTAYGGLTGLTLAFFLTQRAFLEKSEPANMLQE